ncbi:hypothetical protein A2960_00120 [Candidatus Gottesmanbacteria bacterium RIFCSPLOWO2_01_FULL_39_12b]|uniref:Ribosomal RNA large subunit methyltransferase K/L-like methyltransferase domain-containing protein n=1 Tax=Candidatus Gottesmanbacteria bacterium RIFCSPLOWO2_01_FULL_39_12b TaxID=1798388 RepID=A0A1F6AST7_9BACT|nr:MAG: hypothetical protein A2960_00120 [Candidatus Gottesmanbacteria bacterium RIFCSPLOWO2_01_FULL_39_12b]
MNKFFFILGRNSSLSLSEIISYLKSNSIDYTLEKVSSEVAVFLLADTFSSSVCITRLGGTIKIGEVIHELSLEEGENKLYQILTSENLIRHLSFVGKGKIHIGISVYNLGCEIKYLTLLGKRIKDINLNLKKILSQKGFKVGYVRVKERFLTSVSVDKNRLLSRGFEIVLLLSSKNLIIGRTLTIQEYAKFSLRDYGRPFLDKRAGIIPPKLARIMINLAGEDKNSTILDPFCGSGTILQEAIVLGYKNLIGSDISSKAISDTEKNINWLWGYFPSLNAASYNIKKIQTDVRYLTNRIQLRSIDAIITEPYLGPPLHSKPNIKQIEDILKNVSDLYLEAFKQFTKILKPDARVVIIFPVFTINKDIYFLQILEKLISFGFTVTNNISETSERNSIIVGRSADYIQREVICFSFKTTSDH